MKTAIYATACLAAMVFSTGCRRSGVCVVTQYGPEYMTYTGAGEQFNNVCRDVLHELSYKEKVSENSTRYPYYGEGSSSHKDGDRLVSVRMYLKTRDDAGAEYKITTVKLGERDPFVMLESTSSDHYKLVNALNAEFQKKGIQVRQY